jgi:AcrR family transcriptional regulator
MKKRTRGIIEAAVELAEQGGFDAVRQRDVAANAGVALGTLYKRFRSKEDILVAALELDVEKLERRMDKHPAMGVTPRERTIAFFSTVTLGMCKKPNFTRAVVRAVASGQPEVAGMVAAFHGRMTGLIIGAMRGIGRPGAANRTDDFPTPQEATLAVMLQNIWFASLVGWSGGLIGEHDVIQQMEIAADLLLPGYKPAPAAQTPE